MNYSKHMEWPRPMSAYAALSGGVNAWGLGRQGTRGGFGSAGVLGSTGVRRPSAPVLSLQSETAGVVTLLWDVDNTIAAGDTLTRQAQVSGGNWSSLLDNTAHTITAPEDAANQITVPTLTLPNGTYDVRGYVTKSGVQSLYSNTLTFTISDATPAGAIISAGNQITSNSNTLTSV